MTKKLIVLMVIVFTLISSPVYANSLTNNSQFERLAGQDRYQTSKVIAEEYNSGKCETVIIVSGNDFPDALGVSTLASKYNAPILLTDVHLNGSNESIDYIKKHLSANGKIYIIGGTGVIGVDVEDNLKMLGYTNIMRLGGKDRFETNLLIVKEIQAKSGTPVFIASGYEFQGALSISGFAADKGYPILLVDKPSPDNPVVSDASIEYLKEQNPSNLYVISTDNYASSITTLVDSYIGYALPKTKIERISSFSNYLTQAKAAEKFTPSPQKIYVANGDSFPDALAGSILAARDKSPIMLVDNNTGIIDSGNEDYLLKIRNNGITPEIITLGGTGAIADGTLENIQNILNNKRQADPYLKSWVAPQIKSTYKGFVLYDWETLDKELGYYNVNTATNILSYNVFGRVWSREGNKINLGQYALGNVLIGITTTCLEIHDWVSSPDFPETIKVKPVATETLKFYIPYGYEEIVNRLDNWDKDKYDKKIFTAGNREVMIQQAPSGYFFVQFSEPGKKLQALNPSL